MKNRNELKERLGMKTEIKEKAFKRAKGVQIVTDEYETGDKFIIVPIELSLFEILLRNTDLATSSKGGYTDAMRIILLLDIEEIFKRAYGRKGNIINTKDEE